MDAADNPTAARKEFVKRHAGLTTVPVKVMTLADLEVLDLSQNAIEVIPKGLFPDIARLKVCNFSDNSIKVLPDDIAALRELESLVLHHNCLAALPDGLFSLTTVQTLDVSYNRITYLQQAVGAMEALQVLNLSGNRLRSLPSDLGWLGLKQLSITDNNDLHIPVHVLQKGFRAVMSYLQVVGEQHFQVESHMAAFTTQLTELQAKHSMLLPGGIEDEASVTLQVKLAQRMGVLSCSKCSLAKLPAAFASQEDGALAEIQVVDLSFNKLRSCPDDLLGRISNLLVLNVSYNHISSWPAGLHMPALVVLNLSFNNLEVLPDDMGLQLPALQQLYLANNFLTDLPDSLSRLQLQDLFVSENELQEVPQVLLSCTSLCKLSLAACQLQGPCQALAGMSQLRFLDVSFNMLRSLSAELSNLSSLSMLNLSFNTLNTLPDVVSCLTCLRELNIDSTGITSIPEGLGKLHQMEGLQADGCPLVAPYSNLYAKNPLLLVALHDRQQLSVDLSDCKLDAVPDDVLRQTQLTSLSLCRNNIQDLPVGLGNLRRLRQLSLKGNSLRQPFVRLMDTHGELAVLALLRTEGAAGTLNLSACGFNVLPSIVWELPGRPSALMELRLTNNRLRTLPQELSSLVCLTRLVMDNNLLCEVPSVVLTLPSLAVFQACNNSITHLPGQLSIMQALQALMLSGNQVRQLPDSIAALPKLRVLSVASNRLWKLPSSICACGALRLLDCSHNQLGGLPQGMSQMTSLHSLKLTYNRLAWLPVEDLERLEHLEELHVASNAFFVEGCDLLNATGQHEVQQLLAAVTAGGSGAAPATPCPGRCSPALESSWNASASASTGGILAANSSASMGGRTPSPLRASHEAEPRGLLSSLRRAGSRSVSPDGMRERPHGAGVTWCSEAVMQPPCAAVATAEGGSAAHGAGCPVGDVMVTLTDALQVAVKEGTAAVDSPARHCCTTEAAASNSDSGVLLQQQGHGQQQGGTPSDAHSSFSAGAAGMAPMATAGSGSSQAQQAGNPAAAAPGGGHAAKRDEAAVHASSAAACCSTTTNTDGQQHRPAVHFSIPDTDLPGPDKEQLQQLQQLQLQAVHDGPSDLRPVHEAEPAAATGITHDAAHDTQPVSTCREEASQAPLGQQGTSHASLEQLTSDATHGTCGDLLPSMSSTASASGAVTTSATASTKEQQQQPQVCAAAPQQGRPESSATVAAAAPVGRQANAAMAAGDKAAMQTANKAVSAADVAAANKEQSVKTPSLPAKNSTTATGMQQPSEHSTRVPGPQVACDETHHLHGQAVGLPQQPIVSQMEGQQQMQLGPSGAGRSTAGAGNVAPPQDTRPTQPHAAEQLPGQGCAGGDDVQHSRASTQQLQSHTGDNVVASLLQPLRPMSCHAAGPKFAGDSVGNSVITAPSCSPGAVASQDQAGTGCSTSSSSHCAQELSQCLPSTSKAASLHGRHEPRAPGMWEHVPVMDIPRIVRECLQAPAPRPAAADQSAALQPARPQTRARFKRVVRQSATALAMLEYGMKETLNSTGSTSSPTH